VVVVVVDPVIVDVHVNGNATVIDHAHGGVPLHVHGQVNDHGADHDQVHGHVNVGLTLTLR
jgi:hypothetical protein